MTFEEMLNQAMAMLRRRGLVTYRALQRQFQLEDEVLSDLEDELLYAHPEVHDDAGRGLVWTGDSASTSLVASAPGGRPERAPLSYTSSHLTEKTLTSRTPLAGERKQVTVLFADLKGSMALLADRGSEDTRLLDPGRERRHQSVMHVSQERTR